VTPLTSRDAWASEVFDALGGQAGRTRAASMAAHPAGKGRLGIGARTVDEVLAAGRDDQVGIDELLARVTAQPRPTFEERVYDVLFELGALIVEARQ